MRRRWMGFNALAATATCGMRRSGGSCWAACVHACRRLARRRALGVIGRSIPSNSRLRRLWRLTVRDAYALEMSGHATARCWLVLRLSRVSSEDTRSDKVAGRVSV